MNEMNNINDIKRIDVLINGFLTKIKFSYITNSPDVEMNIFTDSEEGKSKIKGFLEFIEVNNLQEKTFTVDFGGKI